MINWPEVEARYAAQRIGSVLGPRLPQSSLNGPGYPGGGKVLDDARSAGERFGVAQRNLAQFDDQFLIIGNRRAFVQ